MPISIFFNSCLKNCHSSLLKAFSLFTKYRSEGVFSGSVRLNIFQTFFTLSLICLFFKNPAWALCTVDDF